MRYLFLFALAAALFACSPKKENSVTLSITATGLVTPDLTISLASEDSTLTKVTLVDGKATVEFALEYPQMVVIQGESLAKPIVFFADLTALTLDINGTIAPPTFTLKGSVYQDSLEAFSRAQQENRAYMENYYPAWEQAEIASDSITLKFLEHTLDSAYKGFEAYTLAFAKRNGIVGAMIAQRYIYTAEYQDLKDIYDGIPAIFKTDQTVIDLKNRVDILENTQIGKRYTEITQQDTAGNPLSIGNVKGEYVLIDFWASWCGPCRAANPDLVRLYQEFHPKGFEIVGVSLDQKEADWKKAVVEDNLLWPQMSDLKGWQNDGAAAYAIRSIPQSILLDNQGFIVRKNLTPAELRAFLAKEL